jgi:dTDP-4-amino-4,6-dideoxygalactose transaminase
VVTDNERFAERLQLIRNHGEAVVQGKGTKEIDNLVGFNYRMTEIEAAIANEQLKKLERLVQARVANADYLTLRLAGLPGIVSPHVEEGVRHGYYIYALRYDAAVARMSRDDFVKSVRAEGIPVNSGYVAPLYLQPLYQQRIAFGKGGYPFSYHGYKGSVSYEPGLCPVTERMHYMELVTLDVCHANVSRADLEDVVAAIEKVLEHARNNPVEAL